MVAAWEAWDAGWTSLIAESINTLTILVLLFVGTKWSIDSRVFRRELSGTAFLLLMFAEWEMAVVFGTSALLGCWLSRPMGIVLWCADCDEFFPTLWDFEQHAAEAHG